jgi:serine/threonine protein kinase
MFLSHRYQILEPLGRGSFGQTYIAEDKHLPGNPRCVVKQLKPISIEPHVLQEARRRFDSEAAVLYELGSHDQIPRLLDRFEHDGEFYLVLELIEGHPLSRELVSGQQLSESYAIALLENILIPLVFVHQHNVIHRDIKPSNLIRRERDGKIFLIDFGAVKQIVDPLETTKLTLVVGTPEYMPIEQWQGRPKLSSDIYAVGTICIQALTGLDSKQLARLFEEGNGTFWWQGIQVSSALIDVLNKMVRPNYQERYPSAIEALQAVRQLSRVPLPPPPPSVPSTLTSPAPSKSYWRSIDPRFWIGMGVALFFGLGSFFLVWSRLIPDSPEIPTSDRFSPTLQGAIGAYKISNNGQTVELTVIGNDDRQYQFDIPRKILDRVPNGSPLPELKSKTLQVTGLKPDRKLGDRTFAIDRPEQLKVLD